MSLMFLKIVTQYIIFPTFCNILTHSYICCYYIGLLLFALKRRENYTFVRIMIQSTESCLGHIVIFNLNLKMVAMFKRTTSINWKGFNIILS